MEDDLIFGKWKTTSIFGKNEDDQKSLFEKGKMSLVFGQMEGQEQLLLSWLRAQFLPGHS